MLFKQLTAYNIEMPKNEAGVPISLSFQQWRDHIFKQAMSHAFQPLAEHQQKGAGWEVPKMDINQEYLISAPERNIHLLCYRMDERKIPTSAVNEQLRRQVQKIEREEKRPVSKIEKLTFKDEIIARLIPHTLPTPNRIFVVLDLDKKTILVGTSSENAASAVRSAMIDQLLPSYEVEESPVYPRLLPPVFCRSGARDHMTRWVTCDNEEMPRNITLNDSVVLQREQSKNIAITGQPMDSEHVRDPIKDGYLVYSLPVTILSGDHEMAVVTLDRYGAFNKIELSNEFKPQVNKEDDDAVWNQLFADLVMTAMNYQYIKDVLFAAFGQDDDALLENVIEAASTWQQSMQALGLTIASVNDQTEEAEDSLYEAAEEHVLFENKVNITSVQRKLRIGYNRAARLIEALEIAGVVSAPGADGTRTVLRKAA